MAKWPRSDPPTPDGQEAAFIVPTKASIYLQRHPSWPPGHRLGHHAERSTRARHPPSANSRFQWLKICVFLERFATVRQFQLAGGGGWAPGRIRVKVSPRLPPLTSDL